MLGKNSLSRCTCSWARSYSTFPPPVSASSPAARPSPADHVIPPKQVRKSEWKRRQEGSNFVDTLSINLFSGKGGAGGVAFHREKFKAKGPPSGGPGGAGGSVYLVATTSLSSLSHLPRTARGGAGSPGGGKWLDGKRGEDVILRVPVGTVVREVRLEEGDEVDRERAERQEMEWAWEASKVRLAEAEKRVKRWDKWKEEKEKIEKAGEHAEPFEELELADVGEHRQAALERIRKELFIMYPQADLSSHPSFLQAEQQLLSKLLSREAVIPGRKIRRRRKRTNGEEDLPLFLDLTKPTPPGEPILILSGGLPGLGNPSFHTAEDRSPKFAMKGGDGDMIRLELELKAGGEVGLVGLPNAGKSTILRALTSSTPRVAAYPFTTLNPHHGTCVLYFDSTFSGPPHGTSITDTTAVPETFSAIDQLPSRETRRLALGAHKTEVMRFTITDNPGLVPKSSLNVGLGHAFLRHIERCSALVYVVDMSAADPIGALDSVRHELYEYGRIKELPDGMLEGRVRGVVANKADRFGVPEDEDDEEEFEAGAKGSAEDGRDKLAKLMWHVKTIGEKEVAQGIRREEDQIWVVPTSAKKRENVSALVQKLAGTIKTERERETARLLEEKRLMEEENEAALAPLRRQQ